MRIWLALSLAMTIVLLSGCRRHEWKQEPTEFLGIKFGVPLKASLPTCSKLDSKEDQKALCAEDNAADMTFVDNAPAPLGLLNVLSENGTVTSVEATTPSGSYDLLQADLVQRYGVPSEESGETARWFGKRITIVHIGPNNGHAGSVLATIAGTRKFETHSNPF